MLADPTVRWDAEKVKPYIQHLLERFGSQRLMWGSDWPVALLATDYAGMYRCMCEAIGAVSASDERQVFGETAKRVYALP